MAYSLTQDTDDYKIGESHIVYITHINDPHSFYVRDIKYDDFMGIFEQPADPVETLEMNMMVIYMSPLKKRYIRGEITSISDSPINQVCDIFGIDYGCADTAVPAEDIYFPRFYYTNSRLPRILAKHCELYMCVPRGTTVFSKDAIDAMKFYVGNEIAKITVIDKRAEKLIVKLSNSCPDDIATMLALTDYTCMATGTFTVNRLKPVTTLQKSYKFEDVKLGQVLHVRVQGGNKLSHFFVAEINKWKEYESTLKKDFTYFCRHDPPITDIIMDDMVGVSYDLKYERAIVKEITVPGSKAMVQLLDWGTTEEVPFSRIKIVTKDIFREKPALALLCSTNEQQTWNNRLSKFLYPGYEFKIEIVKLGNGFEVPHEVNLIRCKHM